MVGLALHRPNASLDEHHPVEHLGLIILFRKVERVLRVVGLAEVQQDGGALFAGMSAGSVTHEDLRRTSQTLMGFLPSLTSTSAGIRPAITSVSCWRSASPPRRRRSGLELDTYRWG